MQKLLAKIERKPNIIGNAVPEQREFLRKLNEKELLGSDFKINQSQARISKEESAFIFGTAFIYH